MRRGSKEISYRQGQVLFLMREKYQGHIEATKRNYQAIADEIGLQSHWLVIDHLRALRTKGVIRSIGSSMTRPEGWIDISCDDIRILD